MGDIARVFTPRGERLKGQIEGERFGSDLSVIVVDYRDAGEGPSLHTHPHNETFVVLEGTARFELDGKAITAPAGSVLVALAGVPHRFENAGPGRLLQVDIHSAAAFQTTWLDR